jgi:hypothetical protein
MPRGTPATVCASFVLLRSFKGSTKLSTTRLTEGRPSPRSMSQWFFTSKSVMSRVLAHVHASLPQSHAP